MGIFSKRPVNRESYLSFITEYKSVMFKIACGYLSSETDAMDAVDESVYLGYANMKQLKEPDYLKTWLTRILINECHRTLRTRKRMIVPGELPEMTSHENRMSMTIREAVTDLPDELKEIIILRYFADYSVKDTAAFLDIPQGTVATRTKKALYLLKADLISMEGGIRHESI
ncbi:MAG TPA: sigma-70 family RNA polymerase sigma factor [Bacteroidales bacterium]|nr:sigma-70 family RNA polymerase sigma factor [Bacteroidales bacterium]